VTIVGDFEGTRREGRRKGGREERKVFEEKGREGVASSVSEARKKE
jgi:hypothetical protein